MIQLSLVVPTYGVENYIPRFLNSLEKNLQVGVEVIVINDGTKDKSAIIAEDFASKYPEYVKVINKENGGISSARNKGLEVAKGEYIIFPDPDDYLADNYVSTILEAINKYNMPDMIFFDYYVCSSQKGFKLNTVPVFHEGKVSKEKFIREFIKDINLKSTVWCKAVKKSYYNDLEFNTKIKLAEDFELLTDLILRLESIVYIQRPLYYYVRRDGSLTLTASLEDLIIFYGLVKDRIDKYSRVYRGLSKCKLI